MGSSGEGLSEARLAEIRKRAGKAREWEVIHEGYAYGDETNTDVWYKPDVDALLAEVERQQAALAAAAAREVALVEMLQKLIRDADATYVDVHPYAGVGHTKIVGPFPSTLEQARARCWSATAPTMRRREGETRERRGRDEGSAMKYKISEMTPGEPYAVLFWQGAWHVVKVDAISATAQDLRVRWLATGFGSFDIAQHVCVNYARRADLAAEREAAGLCACGLPYEAHDANYHKPPAKPPTWTGEEEEYPEDSGSPEMDM